MPPTESPDRRPLVYMIVAVLILGAAAVLFWPTGEEEPPAMVLTTPPTSNPAASVETVESETSGEVEEPASEEIAGDAFPVEDATLDDLDDQAAEAAATQQEKTPPPATTTPPRSTSAGIQPAATGDYLLYVGSFRDRANAERMVSRLADENVQARVATATADGNTVYRVSVGYFSSSRDAESYGRTLQQRLDLSSWVARR